MFRSIIPAKRQKAGSIPHSLELSILFKDFMAYWVGWDISLAEEGPLGPIQRPVEGRVILRGPVRGTLSIRTSTRLTGLLFEALLEKSAGSPDRDSVFREMTALYASHLARTFWGELSLEMGPILARILDGEKGPSPFQCHTYCGLQVQGEPLEIRFWGEMDDRSAA